MLINEPGQRGSYRRDKGINLEDELKCAAFDVRQRHLDHLRALGISISYLSRAVTYPVGIARCEPVSAGMYELGEGDPHLIVPVIEEGVLMDLCAFRSLHPGEWLLRTGLGWALGLEQGLHRWMWTARADPDAKPARHPVGKPVHLFSDPLDWLRGQGEGICVLDYAAPEVRFLDVLPEVICSDTDTAKLVAQALIRPVRLPHFLVTEAECVA